MFKDVKTGRTSRLRTERRCVVRHGIDPAALHGPMLHGVDDRDKSAMTTARKHVRNLLRRFLRLSASCPAQELRLDRPTGRDPSAGHDAGIDA